ncbi:cell envelope biogenesis protein OmpA [Arenibacter sp. N53]|uniref:OmpA family protein n=1 Tax=Arenibacter TaxID=178469 RepID=UPI000CD4238C|nr:MULTISPECIES: OmpA family protein [Arenibacter]MCM4150221.1 cell envelope biogenesis protein OmpA [Arenibacter sp. N53]
MKQLLTACLLTLALIGSAQGIRKNVPSNLEERFSDIDISGNSESRSTLTYTSTVSPEIFKRRATDNHVKSRTFKNLKGADEGFYIVSGVFSDLENAQKLAKKLKGQGFDAGYISNSNNGLNYVYLGKYDNLDKAIAACNTKLNGTYSDSFWLMNVDNGGKTKKIDINGNGSISNLPSSTPTTDNSSFQDVKDYPKGAQSPDQDEKPSPKAKKSSPDEELSIDEVTYDMLSPLEEPDLANNKAKENISKDKGNPNATRLIQKADQYFEKMWYAEAAELYEEAIKKDANNYSFDILQKAGDAHYYNTDMAKAYYYYNIIFERYENEVSPDQIFKYAHTLKGTGKYGKSKRMMRLYDKEVKNGNAGSKLEFNANQKEAILDNILNMELKFGLKNLAINTKYSEFAPMFYNEDEIVFASAKDSSIFNTRRYKWNNQPYLDLYVSKVNKESQDLKEAIRFSKKINSKYHEASVTFTPDNSTMFFTRNNYGKKLKRDKNGVNHLKIYTSKKIDGEWTEAEEVPFNSDDYSTGHPALSPDGKRLYFVSDMPGTVGETDIFVVDVLGDGKYSEPKNLGPEINTEQKEMFPFINDKKLYFASNGHVGLGGLDVYEVAYDEDGFKEVVNMGQPINSNKDDFSYIVNDKDQKGYFASNRRGGKGDDDIYSFERLVLEEVVKNAISGVVTELITGDLMPKALVTLLDENNIKLKEMVTEDDGSFVFEDLDSNTKYTIKTTRSEFFEHVMTAETKENEVVNVDVTMKKLKELIVIEDGIKKLKTDMIFFDFDKSYIRKDASLELDKLVQVMTEYQDMVIKIESHTDSRGPDVYNKYLSDKRAKSTRAYLISKGISADRIESAIGYGEERLINECGNGVRCSSAKHELNRRSEFIIVKM